MHDLKSIVMRANVFENDWLWRRRLGHLNYQSLKNFKNHHDLIYGLLEIEDMKEVCEGCAMGRQHREPFPITKAWGATEPLN